MPNLNQVIIAGHLTRTPELKYASSGTAIAEFGVATNSGTKERPETFFGECVCFGGWADNLAKRGDKGMPILISGRLVTEQWEKDGQKRNKTRIKCDTVQLLHRGEKSQDTPHEQPQQPRHERRYSNADAPPSLPTEDPFEVAEPPDDMPF